MANSGTKCSLLTKGDIAKIRDSVNCEGIEDDRLGAIVTTVISNNEGVTEKNITSSQYIHLLNKAIADSKNQKLREQAQEEKRLSVGDAVVYVGSDRWTKKSAVDNPDTLYVFSDNLQAYNQDVSNPTLVEGLKEMTEAALKRLNVNGSSAIVRTDSNGDRNTNAIGIVVKKNAYDKEGKFLNADEDQFSDSETETVKKLALETVNRIKEAAATGRYKRIRFVNRLGAGVDRKGNITVGNAKLTKANAEAIAEVFRTELGLQSQVLQIDANQPWYYVEFQDPKGISKKIELAEQTKKEKTATNKDKALKSAQAVDPTSERTKEELAQSSDELRNSESMILNKAFKSVQERVARANLLLEMVSAHITQCIDEAVESLSKDPDDVLDSVISGDDITYRELLEHLTTGSRQEQRVYALKHLRQESKKRKDKKGNPISIPQLMYTFEEIPEIMKKAIKDYVNEDGSLKDGNWRQELAASMYLGENADAIWSREFQVQAEQNGWILSSENGVITDLTEAGWRAAAMQAENIVRAYQQMSDNIIYTALLGDIVFDLELIENVRVSGINFAVKDSQGEVDEEYEEGNVDANKEGYMIKYKLLDPSSSMSIRMKQFLGGLYKMSYKNGIKSYEFDSLGRRVKMNPTAAYYTILEAMSGMTKPEDLDEILLEAVEQCPWLEGLIDTIIYNPNASYKDAETGEIKNPFDFDMRVEFYTTFRMSNTKFGKVDRYGFLVRLNKDSNVGTFMNKIAKNFEEHNVMGPLSIYNEDGQINLENASKLYGMFSGNQRRKFDSKEDRAADLKANHPFNWILTVLDASNQRHNVANLIEVLNMLRGEVETSKNADLSNLLKNVGIDTSTLNIDEGILPAVSEEDVAEEIARVQEETGETIHALQALYNLVGGRRCFENIQKVLNSVRIIVNTSDSSGGKNVLRQDDNIVTKYHSAYLTISSVIKDVSDGITKTSFRGPDGNDRYSYTAPDFITRFVDSVKKEDVQQYLEENFGIMDYFRDQKTGKWNNVILESLFEDPDCRDLLDYMNILSMHGDAGFGKTSDVNIGDVQEKDVIINSFFAYFAANDSKSGKKTAYYRNPLFSDVAAMVMLRLPRYTENYKQTIVDLLGRTFEQEIRRIVAVKNGKNTTKVEFYNSGKSKNGESFLLLSEFNKGIKDAAPYITRDGKQITLPDLDTIIKELDLIDAEPDAFVINQSRKEKINEWLTDFMEYQFDRFMQDLSLTQQAMNTLYSKRQKQAAKKATQGMENEIDQETEVNLIAEESDEEEEEITVDERTKIEVERDLEEFFYNDFFMQGQITQIFGGDIAYYKNFRDFIKRNKQAYASGKLLYARDENGEPLKENCLYIEDIEGFSNTYGVINKLLDSSDTGLSTWERDNLRGAIAQFRSICTTDGFSLRTPESFKKIYKAMGGVWNDDMAKAFDELRAGTNVSSNFHAIIKQLKPFLFSYEVKKINGRMEKIPVQHKNSEYVLSALMGAMVSSLTNSPVLRGVQRFMEDNGYDVLHFHSVVKEGFFNAVDLEYDRVKFAKVHPGQDYSKWREKLDSDYISCILTTNEYNNALKEISYTSEQAVYDALKEQTYKDGALNQDMVHTFPLDDLLIVQPSQEHLVDEEALYGSQLRNIVPADLPADFTMELTLGTDPKTGKKLKKKLNRDEAVQFYNTLLVDQYLAAFRRVNSEFSDLEKLHAALMNKMAGNSKYGEDVKKALDLKRDADGNPISFSLPFTSPNLTNKIEELLLSTFKNAIQKQHIEGGNAYLISDFGLSNKLKIHWKTKEGKPLSIEEAERMNKEDLCIDYIPCYLPYTRANELIDFCEINPETGYYEFNFDKMKKTFGEQGVSKILDIIGYRIPTEDKYSIMPIRIMGYLPIQAGSSMVLPSDIVAMSGTDFDIDKLFLMRRAIRREVYSKELRTAYEEYLKKQNAQEEEGIEQDETQASESSEDTEKKAPQPRLGKGGNLTEQEVASLAKRSSVFEEFMTEEGYKYVLKDKDGNPSPRYRILTPRIKQKNNGEIDLDAMSKSASVEERNNMLIDVIWNTLTSNAASKLSMLPGSYPTVKFASRVQRIMHDKQALEEFKKQYASLIEEHNGSVYEALISFKDHEKGIGEGIKLLEAHYDKFAQPQSPLSILDYAKNFRNLMDGNDLIGVFAVNSSSHYKFQFLNLELKEGARFKIDGTEISKIDAVYSPLNGLRIGRICAETQAASPDNGKDPTLGDLNASKSTSGFIGFLQRIGLDNISIGTINNTRDLLAAAPVDRTRYPKLSSDIQFNVDVTKIGDLFIRLQASRDVEDFQANCTENELLYLAQYKDWFTFIEGSLKDGITGVARELNNSSVISRSDSPNGALSISVAEAMQQRMKASDFIEDSQRRSFSIKGFNEFIDITLNPTEYKDLNALRSKLLQSKIPRMQAVYTLGIMGGYSLCQRWLPTMAEPVFATMEELRRQARKEFTSKKHTTMWKGFMNQLLMFLMTDSELFGTEEGGKSIMDKRNYYIHDLPMKYKLFCTKTDGKGNYIHWRWRQTSAYNCLSNKSGKGIHFESVVSASKSKTARKIISAEFNQLLAGNIDEQQMAFALMLYSFYENGNSFRHNSYGLFFDTDFLSHIPGYRELLEQVEGRLRTMDFATIRNFVLQYMVNNPKLIPTIKATYVQNNHDGTITVNNTVEGRKRINSGKNVNSQIGNPVQLLRYVGNIYYLVDSKQLIYKKINGSIPGQTLFYDAKSDISEIDYNALQEAGIIANIDMRKLKDAQDKKAKEEDTVTARANRMDGVDGDTELGKIPEDSDGIDKTADADAFARKENSEGESVSYIPQDDDVAIEYVVSASTVFTNKEAEMQNPQAPKEPKLESLEDGKTDFCPIRIGNK